MHVYQFAGAGAVAPAGSTYLTTTTFDALEFTADANTGVGYRFCTAPPGFGPNVVTQAHPDLRVSDNGNLAVEQADLTRRQPRHFFARQELLFGWNLTLTQLGSPIQLIPEPAATVTLVPPAGGAARTLVRVRPAHLDLGRYGESMRLNENCDDNVVVVTGAAQRMAPDLGRTTFLGTAVTQEGYRGYLVANSLTGGHPAGTDLPGAEPARKAAMNGIAQRWGTSLRERAAGATPGHNPALSADLQAARVNEYARPQWVGRGLWTGSLGTAENALAGGLQVQDYVNGRVLTHPTSIPQRLWGEHWGAVVAMDGADYVTLENYSRVAEIAPAQALAFNQDQSGERLFYHQLYSTGPHQSWHEQWTEPGPRGKAFANAITLVVEAEVQAGRRYFVPGAKDAHGAVAAAGANPWDLQRALLNGLNYATFHLHAPGLLERVASRARLDSWRQAVGNFLAAPGAAPAPVVTLARYVGDSLNAVTRGA